MSTLTAIIERDSDGCVRLPVPEEMRGGNVKVVASLESAHAGVEAPPARLAMGEFGRRVLVAQGAPPMTSANIKAMLEEGEE